MNKQPGENLTYGKRAAYLLLAFVFPLIHLASSLILQLAFLIPLQNKAARQLGEGASAEEIAEKALSLYQNYTDLVSALANLLAILAVLLLFGVICRAAGEGRPAAKEFFSLRRVDGITLLFAAILAIAFYHVIVGVLQLFRLAAPELYESYQNASASLGGRENRVFGFLALVIMAPIAEELIYRAMTISHLEKALSRPWALALSSLLFGLVHGNLLWMLYALLMGLLFGFLFLRTRSIFPTLVMHAVFNLVGFLYSLIDSSRMSDEAVTLFNTLTWVLIALSVLLVPLMLFLILRRTRRAPEKRESV